MPAERKNLKRRWPLLAGTLLCIGAGGLALSLPWSDNLARFSYDVPFLLRNKVPNELMMVYIDSNVKLNLEQPTDEPLSRKFHAQLVRRLAADGARLVLFDVIFDEPSEDPRVDQEFAAALAENGRVILVGDFVKSVQASLLIEAPIPPLPQLRTNAAGWGLAKIVYDADFGIREIDPGTAEQPCISWRAAEILLRQNVSALGERLQRRWLNYYCSPNSFQAINLDQAIDPQGPAPGFFKDKIVIIGARPSVSIAGAARDEFATPYNRLRHGFASGAAIHGIAVLNLLKNDWLSRVPAIFEWLLVLVLGIALGVIACACRPGLLFLLIPAFSMALALGAVYLQLRHNLWWNWVVTAALQPATALLWAGGFHLWIEQNKRRKLQAAFEKYLSPGMADRVVNTEFSLEPGGDACEVTIMFTDLADFTSLSERLRSPRLLSLVLSSYFEEVSQHILRENGTIVKYIGDAVLAVWGAPVPDAEKERNAVMAAAEISKIHRRQIEGCYLQTRIGIHSGTVVAGNLGCKFRFDFSVIGDNVNFASRLESLNKYFGTHILISQTVRERMGDARVVVRKLGDVIVKGKTEAVSIFEILGLAEEAPHADQWIPEFEAGLDLLRRNDLQGAARIFERVEKQRPNGDDPSRLYLRLISRPDEVPEVRLLADGAIKFDAK